MKRKRETNYNLINIERNSYGTAEKERDTKRIETSILKWIIKNI